MQELLGPSAHKLRYTICQQPSLLSNRSETLAARLQGLQQLLECDSSTVCKMVAKAPTVASSDLDKIAGRLQELSQGEQEVLRPSFATLCAGQLRFCFAVLALVWQPSMQGLLQPVAAWRWPPLLLA